MKRLPLLLSIGAFAGSLLLISLATTSPARADGGIGPGTQVVVTEVEDLRFVTGFVPTGSQSPVVFCTLNENSPGFGGIRLSGISVFCRHRSPNFGNGPVPGVAIVVVLPGTFRSTPTEEIALWVSVLHQGALFYGEAQSCQQQCW